MNHLITLVVMVVGLVLTVALACLIAYLVGIAGDKLRYTTTGIVCSFLGRVIAYLFFGFLVISILLTVYAEVYEGLWNKPLF